MSALHAIIALCLIIAGVALFAHLWTGASARDVKARERAGR